MNQGASAAESRQRALPLPLLRTSLIAALGALASCSGGGDEFPSSKYAAKCANPRSGVDPITGAPFHDMRGSTSDEKQWLRLWTDELYLWYREVPPADPAAFATPIGYFNVLKTPAITASGKPKDQFHFTSPTADWEALSQSGTRAGYGVQWVIVASTPPRRVVAAYNEPASPAASAGIRRGAIVTAVDGVDVANGTDVGTINAGLFPSAPNETHALSILDPGAAAQRMVTLVSAAVDSSPVLNVKTLTADGGPVGYFLFNNHFASAEAALIDAVNQLKGAAITDLVLDIRYNGGGYLEIADQLAYMIAGPTPTAGKTFEKTIFNDKYATVDPITGAPLALPFLTTAVGLSAPAHQRLPDLGLSRLFVLTGGQTCSASESIINGLRGVDIQVIQIGSTTCGKPFGFYPQDNCGTTYFSIQTQGVNNKGFGDYADGFRPSGTDPASLPGCTVADDFAHELGDANESRLAAALRYRLDGTCPPGSAALELSGTAFGSGAELLVRSPWEENRIYRR